jgi:ubiquitin-protein ligase
MAQYQVYFDTLEGEKRYDVDFGDDEVIELVLRDIVGELAERGHVMRGLSTGDLKVIWGGAEGRELDLSRTLPEQGVRPNDVLRVLVEMFEAGARSLRSDRIEKEWQLLQALQGMNPGVVAIEGRTPSPTLEVFHVRLLRSPGIESARGSSMRVREEHSLTLGFPRFYPEVPIECHVREPLFHPNVNPDTGFVCLWDKASPRDTVVQAVARVQAMAAYRMVNMGGPHTMHDAAADWYLTVGKPERLVPLTWQELRVYEVREGRLRWIEPARAQGPRPGGAGAWTPV